jgi:hypothetical protein
MKAIVFKRRHHCVNSYVKLPSQMGVHELIYEI